MTTPPRDAQEDVLGTFIDALEVLGVPYFLTGSLAMMYHGSIRATHDADIAFGTVEGMSLAQQLRDRLGAAVYVDVPDDNLQPFNAVVAHMNYKVDFWPVRDDFGRSQIARRIRGSLGVYDAWIASVEDLILSKLRWYKKSQSPLQWADLTSLIALHRDTLDRQYLERWADTLGIRTHLDAVWNSSSFSPQ